MRLRKGITLVETLVVILVLSLTLLIIMESMLGGLRSYRHGIYRADILQNARNVLDRIRLEAVKGAVSLELISGDPRFYTDERHNILKVYFEGEEPLLIGCYKGIPLPGGEDVFILGMLKGGSSVQPLTDGYDGGKDSFWVSVEEFKVRLLPGGNPFVYGDGNMSDKGAFIYLKLSGPGGLETKKFKKAKFLEVSTVVYLRK